MSVEGPENAELHFTGAATERVQIVGAEVASEVAGAVAPSGETVLETVEVDIEVVETADGEVLELVETDVVDAVVVGENPVYDIDADTSVSHESFAKGTETKGTETGGTEAGASEAATMAVGSGIGAHAGESATGEATSLELPHWTEPPTGQVPRVLRVDPESDSAGLGLAPPTWREEDADWVAHEEAFEPGMFSTDESVATGSLDESDESAVERRPWEFDLTDVRAGSDPVGSMAAARLEAGDSSSPEKAPPFDGDAEDEAGRRPTGRPTGVFFDGGEPTGQQPVVIEEVAAASTMFVGDSEDEAMPPRPQGQEAELRVRRSGFSSLRDRIRVARGIDEGVSLGPDDLPGAVVTEVPGAALPSGGIAGLARGDRRRTARRTTSGLPAVESDPSGSPTSVEDGDESSTPLAVVADLTTESGPDGSSGSAVDGAGDEEVLRGAPPAPRIRRAAPEAEDGRKNSTAVRVATGVAVAVVALIAFELGSVACIVLTLLVAVMAAGECFGVLRKAGYHPATLLGLVGTVALMLGAYNKGTAALPLVMMLIVVFTMLWYVLGIESGPSVPGAASTLLAVGWIGLLASFAGLILSPSINPDGHGVAFFVGAVVATAANDIGALVVGGWVGRRPLAPTISPNKTWEGWAGGALASILVSTVVVGAIHPWTPATAAVLGLVVAVVGPVGDLCESLFKRDLGLKDMGAVLPGHGGLLDRVDALLFVLPATYYLVHALNIK